MNLPSVLQHTILILYFPAPAQNQFIQYRFIDKDNMRIYKTILVHDEFARLIDKRNRQHSNTAQCKPPYKALEQYYNHGQNISNQNKHILLTY